MPVWREVLERVGAQAYFAITLTNPLEVAHSLQKRDALPVALGCLLWLEYLLEAERATRGAPQELLRKPSQTAERLVGQLGFDALVMSENSARKISEFMDPEMRHRRA